MRVKYLPVEYQEYICNIQSTMFNYLLSNSCYSLFREIWPLTIRKHMKSIYGEIFKEAVEKNPDQRVGELETWRKKIFRHLKSTAKVKKVDRCASFELNECLQLKSQKESKLCFTTTLEFTLQFEQWIK